MPAPDLQPLSRPQRHQVVVEWNDSRKPYTGCRLLHHLFEIRATASPDAVAGVLDDDHLSYAELDRLADLLARQLESLGVGPESLVGLCLDDGLEVALGVLAILKAGGAFVPLDPAYPKARLRRMLRAAGVSVLLTRRRLCRRLGVEAEPRGRDPMRALYLDPGWRRRLARPPAQSGVGQADPGRASIEEDGVAYVIFTSGSTGRPKGVAVSHRAVVNRLRWSQDAWPLSPADRVLQQAAMSFDFSVWELFGAWMAGALVVWVPPDQRSDVERLADLVHDAGVTVLHFVPSLLAEFLTASRPRAPSVTRGRRFDRLRRILSGGEALSPRLRDLTLTRLGVELINQYGPTEATIDATSWHCRRADRSPTVPIGRPVANTRIHILNARQQPVPAGVEGEIHIAGVALARGYVGSPGRTARRFIPDSLTREPGERLYRTGDRARFRSDGAIDFLGRRDHQLKVRGVRVELAEIEVALEQHQSVRQAVVSTVAAAEVGPGAGGPWLVAWMVPVAGASTGAGVGAAELHAWLRERLPDAMIPAVFLPLARLPRLATGKVDRGLLAGRAARRLQSNLARDASRTAAAGFVAPRTPQEGILAEIWSEVLGTAPIGVHDHFFELGGHSLLAGRVVSRIRRVFGLDVPIGLLFKRPTVAGLARGLTEARRAKHQPEAMTLPPLEPTPRGKTERWPLTFAQERLWFLDRLEPGSSAYNLPSALRLKGSLDASALEGALRLIVQRHEALRTRFPNTDGKPYQDILPHSFLRLAIVDLALLAPECRLAEARSLAAAEAVRPFDLARGPLIRAMLLRLGRREHVLLLTLHHIVSDRWSHAILHRELTVLYKAACGMGRLSMDAASTSPALPELPVQVADVAWWQRRWLRGEALATLSSYWRRQLGDRLSVLELPADRPRPTRSSYRGTRHPWQLGESLTAGLHELSIASGASLYMTLLAAFMAFLHRLTQQPEILIGSPIAGRGRSETENLIGLFINTLVMRGHLEDGPSFSDHLARVRATALDAYAHQELPFEKLVEDLQPDRDPNRNPIFQVTLVLHNAPAPEPRLEGLELQPFDAGATEPARFDLALYLLQDATGLRGTLVGSRDLFDRTTLARFCHGFESLLEGAVAEPGCRVAALSIMSRAQRHQLMSEWAGGRGVPAEDRSGECLHRLFEARVARMPEAVALAFGGQRMSYRQLDQRADRLAASLARPDFSESEASTDVVAICLERSLEMVVAVLAVLKSGAAYMYLDPTYPRSRRLLLLADARAGRLLTSPALAPDFGAWHGEIIWDDEGARRGMTPEMGQRNVWPESDSHLTYTSGSTGRPKGVIGSHGAAVDYVRFVIGDYDLGPQDVALQIASLAFDRSIRDLLAPLVAGATVVVSRATDNQPEDMLREIEGQRVTCLPAMIPSLLRQLAAVAKAREATHLRLVLFAGERLTWSDHRAATSLFGRRARLVNLYGPTEGTCTASSFALDGHRSAPGSIAIGRPHPRASIYLVDRALRLVPAGAAGEIILAGTGLARGYLGRPAESARAFVPSPFSSVPGGRLYRTGDLARHRWDGILELLGRIDHQLKIRGFRIEPEEIEATLARHPAVGAAVVVGRQDVTGDQRLVAYVQTAATSPSAGSLRRFLRRTLPDYLVPSIFLPLEALPLTSSGKVDRGLLARQPIATPAGGLPRLRAPVAPRGPIEEILADIWRELLEVEDVGAHDHFFELGGHSLLAARVMARIRSLLGVELPLRRLFERPTLADLARAVLGSRSGGVASVVPPLEIGTRPAELPLSFAQERLWFLDRLEPSSPAYNMAAAWHLNGRLDAGALGRSLDEILRRHEVLRSRFPTFGEESCQVIVPRSRAKDLLRVVDLGRLACHRRQSVVRSLAAAEAARPFDLARGPLVRAVLLCLAREEYVLLLTVHHIVSDAWSQSNLYRELAILYRAEASAERASGTAAGRPRLPELPVQYADYALWQRGWLRGAVQDAQLAYWKRQLGGDLPVLRLPADRPRSAVRSGRCGVVPLKIPGALTARLMRSSSDAGASLFMSLLAAFAALLSRYSGQLDVVVGTPIANRGRSEVEPLIGLFANTLVLRVDLAGGDRGELDFRELLERVRDMALDAYAHQDMPFERLVDALQPQRRLDSSPLFQVMFALHNTPVGRPELEGLRCAPLETGRPTAKFDLSLSLRENIGELVYKAELFDATRIRRMARHWITLLGGAVENPDRPLAQLPLLSAAERQQLVVEWNDTRTECPERRCMHQLLERQAVSTPDRIALSCGDMRVTYRQLDELAARLAEALTRRGVGRGDVVPVLVPPGLDVPIAWLAVMKSGAAFSPLDVRWPRRRISRILEELDCAVVLDEEAIRSLGADSGVARAARPSKRPVALEDPIYVMYTSGSTGEPKAAINTQVGVVNRLLWMDREYGRDRDRVVLQTTHHVFDSSVWQLFWPLLSGGRSVVSATRESFDPDHLIDVVERERVTFTDFVPSVFDVLVDRLAHRSGAARRLESLRQLIIGGEAINDGAVDRFRGFLPEVGFSNLYGPTETAIGVIFHRVVERATGSGPAPVHQPIPIGRPIDNVAALLLDDSLSPVPIGVPGEIHIGGVCVGLGYRGDPEQTARVFIDDPGCRVGGKLYKTGDLARYRADGKIEFLGRVDHQIKIRGHRIEPGEIESVLGRHPAVREAAVVVSQASHRGRAGDERRLVAYLVAEDRGRHSGPVSGAELRDFLDRRLPRHMVPSELILLESLPLTAGGKVDRVALEDQTLDGLSLDDLSPDGLSPAVVAPRTSIERELAVIWSEVLGLAHPAAERPVALGVSSDFFALGGHSLLAVRLMTRIERRFQVRLPLSALFDRPTIAGLAERISAGGSKVPATPLVLIRPPAIGRTANSTAEAPFFCVHPVGGQVLCYQELAHNLDPKLPFYGVRAWGTGDGEAFDPEVADMAARYSDAIRDLQPRGPYRLGGWSMGGAVAFEIAHRLHRQGEEVEALVLIDASAPAGESHAQSGALASSTRNLARFARDLGLTEDHASLEERLAGLGIDAGLRQILLEARRAGILPPDVDRGRIRDLFRLFENNRRALRGYRPQIYPGRLTLLRSSHRPADGDATLGWGTLAAGGVDVHTVGGDHFTMLREPHVRKLARRLEACMSTLILA